MPLARRVQPAVGTRFQNGARIRKAWVGCANVTLLSALLTSLDATAAAQWTPAAVSAACWYRTRPDDQVPPLAYVRLTDELIAGSGEPRHVTVKGGGGGGGGGGERALGQPWLSRRVPNVESRGPLGQKLAYVLEHALVDDAAYMVHSAGVGFHEVSVQIGRVGGGDGGGGDGDAGDGLHVSRKLYAPLT